MAGGTTCRLEKRRSSRRLASRSGRSGRRSPFRHEGGKGFRLVGDDDEAHQCMWAAAIFRALPRINAGLVRLYSHDIASAGDHVQLAREPRYPEAVNDIGGFQLQRDRLADRHVKLVGIEHHGTPLPLQIRHPPPPHFASDPDPHFISGGGIGKVVCQRQAINEKRAQNDDRGRDAADPYDLLAADLILEATLSMKCDPQRRDDGQQHERRHGQQHPCQYRDWAGKRTSRIKHGRRPTLQGVSERRACRDTRQHRVTPFASGAWRAWSYSARSEEHTSELQSLMRISYAVFCLKKKKSTRNMYMLEKKK